MRNKSFNRAEYRDEINLDKEFTSKEIIYEQQKEYRKTPEGKTAIKRANERMLLKKMKKIGKIKCDCGETKFEFLNIYDNTISCYNCRYEREEVLEEEEIAC
jgi:hypothetical protein